MELTFEKFCQALDSDDVKRFWKKKLIFFFASRSIVTM